MPRPATAALPLLLALALALPSPARGEGADGRGPPAFLPLEDPAADAALRGAARLAAEGRAAEAVEAYQEVADGPLWDRLAPNPREPDTLEQARERAQREMSLSPALVEATRRRHGETAGRLLGEALAAGDARALRGLFARHPLTAAGARAGLLLAREAHRRGDAEEALGILERLGDLHPRGLPPGVRGEEVEAIRGAAGAAAAPPPSAGPRGPLVLRWSWAPDPGDRAGSPDPWAFPAGGQGALPPPADHSVAVEGGVVYWTDRFRLTAISLETGAVLAVSADVTPGAPPAAPGQGHRGETFAPAAGPGGVVAFLDLPERGVPRGRTGTINLFALEGGRLSLLERRGGDADPEDPALSRRFVFHGRPLLDGDRVFAAATEAASGRGAGDVRTHLLCFRRGDLALLWDTFVSYGSGSRWSDVAPAGSPAARRGRVYFATHTGVEACLDARTGAVLWARRYRTPEMAPVPRLATAPDRTMEPLLWHESPVAFSGEFLAVAPRNSYFLDFLRQRPDPASGSVLLDDYSRPRRDGADMMTLWVVPGPPGTFFLAGQSGGPEEAPLMLRDLDPGAREAVRARYALMETAIAGLPAVADGALYAATGKALYRIPLGGRDGEVERLAAIPVREEGAPLPSPGNLVVLPDRVLSVADDGILCFGPPR